MIRLRETFEDEVPSLCKLDQQPHACDYIIATPESTHRGNLADKSIIYLTIVDQNEEMAGYFILVREPEHSIEFRRILIEASRRGIGQTAITLMEDYCWNELDASRIWLDVFEDNSRGIHIYEKMGYRYFRTVWYEGRKLFYYEKLKHSNQGAYNSG